MLTIPYDRGWQVKVDGVPAETTSRYGQFLAVDLEPVRIRWSCASCRKG